MIKIKKKKIVFFGDSVLFSGSYISNKDMFSEKICSEYLIEYICGNYGVNGYLLQNLTDRIKQIEKKRLNNEKLIIVISNSFDYGKTNFNDLPLYENFNIKIFGSSIEIINHILFKYKILDRYHKDNKINFLYEPEKDKNLQLDDFLQLLENLWKKKEIFLFILPTLEILEGQYTKVHFLDKVKTKNIKIINLYDNLINKDFQNLYFNNAHLNKKGHDYLAKIIYEYLK